MTRAAIGWAVFGGGLLMATIGALWPSKELVDLAWFVVPSGIGFLFGVAGARR